MMRTFLGQSITRNEGLKMNTELDPETAAWLAQKASESEAKRRAAFAKQERQLGEPGVSHPAPDEPPLGHWSDR